MITKGELIYFSVSFIFVVISGLGLYYLHGIKKSLEVLSNEYERTNCGKDRNSRHD